MSSHRPICIVIDANVFVSACITPSGFPGKIIRFILDYRKLTLVMTSEIINEIKTTLAYSRVLKYLKMSEKEIDGLILSLELISDYVTPTIKYRNILDDTEDEKYLNCAVEGMADIIISVDKHLLSQKEFKGIAILTPKNAWNKYFNA